MCSGLYLSVGSMCLYFEDPPMKVRIASSMATAGMANPIAQEMLSWMYTTTVTASREPKLMAK